MTLVKTLSAIALGGLCLPAAHAVSISDDVVKLGVGVRIQSRAQVSDSTPSDNPADPNDDEYNVQNGGIGANDPIDFSLRRVRLMFTGSYGPNWKFNSTIFADGTDRNGGNTNRAVNLRYCWVERAFKMDGDMAHLVKFGLDKPWFNIADVDSSSRMMFPTKPATDTILNPRGVGLSYKFATPILIVGADLQNNTAAKPAGLIGPTGTTDNDVDEGYFYSGRLEFTPLFNAEWFDAKRSHSYVGKEGHHLMLGLKYGVNDKAITGATPAARLETTTTAYGIDALFHFNQITLFADWMKYNAQADQASSFSTAPETDIDAQIITAQLGYAFNLGGDYVLEPCLRYAIIDLDQDNDSETRDFGQNGFAPTLSAAGVNISEALAQSADAEHGGSGNEIEVGLNLYLDGHNNKFSLAYSMWKAEEGDGDANIIRLQHQLNF